MKKEKTIKSYQRRTKSGKVVTVRQHTAKYEASDKKDASRKDGAGDELEVLKKKGDLDLSKIADFKGDPNELTDKERQAWQILTGNYPAETESKLRKMKSLEKVWAYVDAKNKNGNKKTTKNSTDPYSAHGFTKEEFAEWYEGTGSSADKKVAKALRKILGSKDYNALNDAAADNYKKGGAANFFTKNISAEAKSAGKSVAKSETMAQRVERLEKYRGDGKDLKGVDKKIFNAMEDPDYDAKLRKSTKDKTLKEYYAYQDKRFGYDEDVPKKEPLKQFKGVETSGNYMTFGKEKALYYDHYMGGGRDYFTSSEYKKVHSMAKKDIAKLEKAGYSAHFEDDGYVVIDGPIKKSSKGVKDKVVDKFLDGKSIIDDVKKPKKQTPKTEKAPKSISASSVMDLLKKTYKNNLGKVTAKDGHITISLEGKAYGDGYSSWSQYDVSSGSMESEGNSRHTEGIIKKLKGLKGVKSITVKESFD